MKYLKIILSFILYFCVGILNIKGQDLLQDLSEIKNYNVSSNKIRKLLSRSTKNFHYYNSLDKEKANDLLNEILILPESFINSRNEFLFKVYFRLDSIQRILVRKEIENDLNPDDSRYNEIVSRYRLKSHRSKISARLDTLYFSKIISDFTSENRVSNYNIQQLLYRTTLNNLSDENIYEDEILELLQRLYEIAKNEKSLSNSKRKFLVLYKKVLPNSIGKMLSKSSVLKSIYFLDEPKIIIYSGYDVEDSNLAWEYLQSCVFFKLTNVDQKYWDIRVFNESKSEIKKELQSKESIWRDYIR